MSILNIGLSGLVLTIDSCIIKWFKNEVLNGLNLMASVRDSIEKYDNAYPVAIDILKRCLDNMRNKRVLENNTLFQENGQNTDKYIGYEIRKLFFVFWMVWLSSRISH